MSPISMYGFTYDLFPNGHYVHPFHDRIWEYTEDEGKEPPRTVRFLLTASRLRDLT